MANQTAGKEKEQKKTEDKGAKVNRTTMKNKGLTEKQIDEISKNTGKLLSGEDKVKLIIPKIDGESDYVECSINGYNYVIKKGELISVPRSVVEVLRNSKLL